MHSDLGGFAGANLDDELYSRWLQYGVFQPIFRPHAQEEVPSEPVFREAKTKDLAKQAIELRYKLLPYNYTLAFENSRTGAPFMRPLLFLEPNNKSQQLNANTFLWGSEFLVTPIVHSGISEKEVYFPKNHAWFDFYTDDKVEGGQSKMVKTNEKSIPTYVKAGAFIPMARAMQTTDDYDANNIDLHYYHDISVEESSGQLYHDDGLISNAYEKGNYEHIQFKSEFNKRCLDFKFECESGSNFNSQKKQIKLLIHNILKMPKRVKVNGKKINFDWDKDQKIITIPIDWNSSNTLKINLKLSK
jgi:alpha-glucosidase (family GH31 glycosyl hydrolase)